MIVRIRSRGSVDCHAVLELRLPAASVWGQVRDFQRYARHDFFHQELNIQGDVPRRGAGLELSHQFFGFTVRRVGRIVWWREGAGYSFSDLSRRGPRHGFPHVFSYRIEAVKAGASRLHVRVRGLWTARFVPRWAARLWLRWVFGYVVRSVENELLLYQVWRQRRAVTRPA